MKITELEHQGYFHENITITEIEAIRLKMMNSFIYHPIIDAIKDSHIYISAYTIRFIFKNYVEVPDDNKNYLMKWDLK
jgi:hypothetical protein